MIRFRVFRRLLLPIAFFALLPVLKAGAQQPVFSPVGASGNLEFCSGVEQESFLLVNEYRKKNRLPPLFWDNNIAQIARGHSRNMATGEIDFGHDGFGDRVSKLKVVMTGLKGCGENVLKTDDPDQVAAKAVALWLRSPAHLHNIRGDYNHSGMGIWQDDHGMIYFTQIFVKIIAPQTQTAQTLPAPQVTSPFGLIVPSGTRAQP
jgi:uncharacterized protein YkwD